MMTLITEEKLMQTMKTAAVTSVAMFSMLGAGAMFAQTGTQESPSAATGVRAIIHSVADLDKTVTFYRDGLGLEMVGLGGKPTTTLSAPRALDESLSKFTATQGAKFRNATFKIPGAKFDLELTEFTDTPRKNVQPHMQDPGAATLVLNVRDVDAALVGVNKSGGSVLTIGGQPMKLGGENSKSRSVFVRDPDGFMLELAGIQPPPPSDAPASSDVLGGRIGITIENTDQTLKFYHDVLGFEIKPAPAAFATNKTIPSLIDAEGAQWRISTAKIPGSPVDWEFLEFKGVARKPFHLAVPDIGSPAVSVHVKDVNAAIEAVKTGGGSIVTTGGQAVKLGNGVGIFVRDPNGLLLELIPGA
jgi:catechol 2,3-dioxygenase-like lactoylglutathione lyase family enzyme